MKGAFAIVLVFGMLAWATPAAASDDCVATSGVQACALDDHCTATFQNYRSCVNTLAAASASVSAAGVGASGGAHVRQVEGVGCGWPLCGWRNTVGGANVGVTSPAGTAGAQAWVLQSEVLIGDTPRPWYNITGAGAAVQGAGHGASLAYMQYSTSTTCSDWVAVGSTLGGRGATLPCVLGVPQLMGTCVAGAVCGRFPDWPENMGLPFL